MLNSLHRDGMGFAIQTLFLEKANHLVYQKYFPHRQWSPPISMDDLQALSEMIKNGDISSDDLSSFGGVVRKPDEFLETNQERKNRTEKEKSTFQTDVVAKSKTKPNVVFHKKKI